MFKKLFSTDPATMPNDAFEGQDRGLGALRTAYSDWRFGNDVGAIVATLNRLSNHRLRMIGLDREGLADAVTGMMLSVEEDRAIGQEIVAILDAPAESTFSCDQDTMSSEEYTKQTETPAKQKEVIGMPDPLAKSTSDEHDTTLPEGYPKLTKEKAKNIHI